MPGWNPYLDDWAAACGHRVGGWVATEFGRNPLERRPLAAWRGTKGNRHQIRMHLTHWYAFGVPTEEALDCLARYAPIVEVGAGTGYWARCLRERGIDVLAYDELGEEWRTWFRPSLLEETDTRGGIGGVRELVARPDPGRSEPFLWTEVAPGGPEVVGRHAGRTLLLCWPGPWNAFDEAALRAHRGDHVAFVGDPAGGSSSRGLRRLLRREWTPVEEAPVARWPATADSLVVWRRGREGRGDSEAGAVSPRKPKTSPCPTARSTSMIPR
jgi:hypothetical protein